MPNSSSDPVACPVCDSQELIDFFSLRLPTNTGRLLNCRDEALIAPIGDVDLSFCNNCGLIYNRSYDSASLSFEPGFDVSLAHSSLFRSFVKTTADRLIERYDLQGKTAVEVGCGTGDFLSYLCRAGSNSGYGFDPSIDERSTRAVGAGSVSFIPGFYTQEHSDLAPDFLCALGVLDCIEQPIDFLQQIHAILANSKTVVYFEVFGGENALLRGSNWSIHYESCNYWSEDSLVYAFEKAGYTVTDVGSCYGAGEYLYLEARPNASVGLLKKQNITIDSRLLELADYHRSLTSTWEDQLVALYNAGDRVAVWGTGGKGITFLNMFASTLIGCVIDINPNRQGTFTPSSGHLIEPPVKLCEFLPTLIIITNPLYQDEIRAEVLALGLSCELAAL